MEIEFDAQLQKVSFDLCIENLYMVIKKKKTGYPRADIDKNKWNIQSLNILSIHFSLISKVGIISIG